MVDANGEVIVKADDKEQLVYADVDMAESKNIRGNRPYTGLRRTEFYK